MNIKAIIFDYGEVLNSPADPEMGKAHRARLARQMNLAPDEVWPYLFDGELSRKWMTGQLAWDGYWTEVLAPLGITDPAEVEAFPNKVFAGNNQLNPEMAALLKSLHGRYRLAILSNTSWTEEEMRAKFTNGFNQPADIFDVVVTSRSVGSAKPEPRIYQIVLERLGVQPAEAIFIDDMPSFTAAAAKLGIHTHTFGSPAALRAYLKQMGVL